MVRNYYENLALCNKVKAVFYLTQALSMIFLHMSSLTDTQKCNLVKRVL
jgi:hypothetical protein